MCCMGGGDRSQFYNIITFFSLKEVGLIILEAIEGYLQNSETVHKKVTSIQGTEKNILVIPVAFSFEFNHI